MKITCTKCSQDYHIPDYKIEASRLDLKCENCGHKIVVFGSSGKEAWMLYRGLSDSHLTVKNILDGIFYSFNLKNFFLSFFVLLSLLLFITPFTLFIFYNKSVVTQNPLVTGIIGTIILIIMKYVYDIHLYLLSLNTFNRINTGISMKFSMAKDEIMNDLKSIFIFSIGIIILFAALFMPVFLMKDRFILIYEGIFHFVLVIMAIILIALSYFKKIIYAFIASRSRSLKYTFRSLIRFFINENINIPIYVFFSNVLSGIISIILLFVLTVAIMLIILILSITVSKEMFFLDNVDSVSSFLNKLSIFQGSGTILFLISTGLILLFIIAYIINLRQSLSTVSTYIMELNPGQSVNKNAVLIGIIVILVLAGLSISI